MFSASIPNGFEATNVILVKLHYYESALGQKQLPLTYHRAARTSAQGCVGVRTFTVTFFCTSCSFLPDHIIFFSESCLPNLSGQPVSPLK